MKQPKRVSFGAGYPADVHAHIPADVRGQKLRSGLRNPRKTSKKKTKKMKKKTSTRIRESFCESEVFEGVRLPRERADLRGSPGNFRGSLGGTSGEVWETSGEPLDCCKVPQWENFQGSPGTS